MKKAYQFIVEIIKDDSDSTTVKQELVAALDSRFESSDVQWEDEWELLPDGTCGPNKH